MRVLGLPEAAIESLEAQQAAEAAASAPGVYEVLPANWPAVQLFLACASQWRIGADGLPLALDYAGVLAAARMRNGAAPDRALFAALQVLEHAALKELRRRHAKRRR